MLQKTCAVLASLLISTSIATLLSSNSARGEQAKTMSKELIEQLEKDKFSELKSVSDLPASVKSFYTKDSKAKDIKNVIADRGEDYQAGCNQMPGGAPSKSFLVGAKSPSMCMVYYESGGFVLLDAIDLFKYAESGTAEKVWSSSMFRDHPKTAEQLVEAVKTRIKEPIK